MCGGYLSQLRIQHRQDAFVEVQVADSRRVAAGSDFGRFEQAHAFELTLHVGLLELDFAFGFAGTDAANEKLGGALEHVAVAVDLGEERICDETAGVDETCRSDLLIEKIKIKNR